MTYHRKSVQLQQAVSGARLIDAVAAVAGIAYYEVGGEDGPFIVGMKTSDLNNNVIVWADGSIVVNPGNQYTVVAIGYMTWEDLPGDVDIAAIERAVNVFAAALETELVEVAV